MTIREAIGILTEMQKWRRAEGKYSSIQPSEYRCMPYTPEEFGKAIDVAIERMENELAYGLLK